MLCLQKRKTNDFLIFSVLSIMMQIQASIPLLYGICLFKIIEVSYDVNWFPFVVPSSLEESLWTSSLCSMAKKLLRHLVVPCMFLLGLVSILRQDLLEELLRQIFELATKVPECVILTVAAKVESAFMEEICILVALA